MQQVGNKAILVMEWLIVNLVSCTKFFFTIDFLVTCLIILNQNLFHSNSIGYSQQNLLSQVFSLHFHV
jgi:hypothetical protein